MKRLKSSDNLNSQGAEKGVYKDWGRKNNDSSLHRSSSHNNFHYKSESGKRGLSSSSTRYIRVDDHESLRPIRKRSDYDSGSSDRRKSYDRYRDSNERGISSSPRAHRSESFSGPRKDFPKGFRSERDRSRREGSVSSWRRLGGEKEVAEGTKSGGDSSRGSKAGSEEMGKVRSPQRVKDTKSTPWSKDSQSEQSKRLEVKKSESLPAESGNNSEMEEGELEPEPEPDSEPALVLESAANGQPPEPLNTRQKLHHENGEHDIQLEGGEKLVIKEEIKHDQTCDLAEKAIIEEPDTRKNIVNNPSNSQDSSTQRTGDIGVAIESPLGNGSKTNAECSHDCNDHEKEAGDLLAGNSKPLDEKAKQDEDIYLEVKEENVHASVTKIATGHRGSGVVHPSLVTKELTGSFKDKGKNVAVSSSNGADSLQQDLRIEDESRGFLISGKDDKEGSSKRGFELFFTDPIKKPKNAEQTGLSKTKDEKQSFEPLKLSLSLPNVLLPIGSENQDQGPVSPSQDTSIQSFASSFQTNSDGFTVSRSFSGFTHNPSCSLTHNSVDPVDPEKSVGSRPLFQGVAWQVQSSEEHKNGELPILQGSLSNKNEIFYQYQTSNGISNGQAVQLQSVGVEGSSQIPLGLERQLSTNNKQPSGSHSRHLNKVRENISVLSKSTSKDEKDKLFTCPLLSMVVSDPLHVVARKLNEMTGRSLAYLKESVQDIILNPNKQRELSAFQKALESRSDITLETLLKAHSVQIEIFVALKTKNQDFLKRKEDISSSDLAEIFLNMRCRNLACRSYLPVDECDCKICVQKNGFCSACMCLICSKFDMASNTCSWVGCDVCLHWCHTDCGLIKSYIRNGFGANGAQGQTEMQFHCVACDHPSEMFGFVGEVFQNFAKGWTMQALSNELEYVRKIFSGSRDIRGRRLHEISLQMLKRLANKSDLQQVRSYIMGFLADGESFKSSNIQILEGKEVKTPNQGSNDIHKTTKYVNPNPNSVIISDIQRNTPSTPREPVFEELDSIVRIKLAEAKMFQTRADDARREAEGLKRIALAKTKKIEEEFATRIAKLHLSEAEEIRKQKCEEIQGLENAHKEYFNMKVRMEREIKDLLLKMETTKRKFRS